MGSDVGPRGKRRSGAAGLSGFKRNVLLLMMVAVGIVIFELVAEPLFRRLFFPVIFPASASRGKTFPAERRLRGENAASASAAAAASGADVVPAAAAPADVHPAPAEEAAGEPAAALPAHSIYKLHAVDIEGHDVPLSRFAGKVTLVVNVASQ